MIHKVRPREYVFSSHSVGVGKHALHQGRFQGAIMRRNPDFNFLAI